MKDYPIVNVLEAIIKVLEYREACDRDQIIQEAKKNLELVKDNRLKVLEKLDQLEDAICPKDEENPLVHGECCESDDYSIEPHGEGYAIYLGRCNHRHGYQKAFIDKNDVHIVINDISVALPLISAILHEIADNNVPIDGQYNCIISKYAIDTILKRVDEVLVKVQK